jgi:GTP cyclohydrolase II
MAPQQAHLHVMTNNPTKCKHLLSYGLNIENTVLNIENTVLNIENTVLNMENLF